MFMLANVFRAVALRAFAMVLFLMLFVKVFAGDTATIVFTGDILLDRGVRQRIATSGVEALFSESVDSVFGLADVVVGNLECPATKIKEPVFKRFVFRGEPEWLEALRRHGFTHLNMANNHSIDQGREGLMDTRKNIELAGMTPIGAGRNMAEASVPVVLTTSPRKVYLFASLRLPLENMAYLTDRPCVSQESMDTLVSRIERLRREEPESYIIVSLHWGVEHRLVPQPSQIEKARRLVDAGADCLVCHHTHTLQTVENYRGRRIYY
ncbi:MAG: CapA family protein, partial [Prevotella micans]|nr:CapA family protein [Prevotella micans]